MSKEIHLELMLGRRVIGLDGKSVGRLQEVRTEKRGGEEIVTEYLIGVGGLLERLSVETWRSHSGGFSSGLVAKWNQLDLSDTSKPRLICDANDLEVFPPPKSHK